MDKRINIETERAAFEAWAKEVDYDNLGGEYTGSGKTGWWYWDDLAAAAWDAWQARATPPATGAMEDLPPLPMTKAQYGFDNTLSFCAHDMRQYGREAIAHFLRKQAGQDESDDGSNVLRPFAAPASQHEAIIGAVARGWCAPANADKPMDEELAYAIVAEVEAELARRGRAQGGNTNSPLAYIPPHIMESLRNGCRVGTVLEPKPDNGCTEALYGR